MPDWRHNGCNVPFSSVPSGERRKRQRNSRISFWHCFRLHSRYFVWMLPWEDGISHDKWRYIEIWHNLSCQWERWNQSNFLRCFLYLLWYRQGGWFCAHWPHWSVQRQSKRLGVEVFVRLLANFCVNLSTHWNSRNFHLGAGKLTRDFLPLTTVNNGLYLGWERIDPLIWNASS